MNPPPTPWFDAAYEEQLLRDTFARLPFDRSDARDSRRAAEALAKAAIDDPYKTKVLELQAPWVQHALPLRMSVVGGRLEAEYADTPPEVVDSLRRILSDPSRLSWLVERAHRWLSIFRRESPLSL